MVSAISFLFRGAFGGVGSPCPSRTGAHSGTKGVIYSRSSRPMGWRISRVADRDSSADPGRCRRWPILVSTTTYQEPRLEYRRLGKTGRTVSAIGFGAWAIGGGFGSVDDVDSLRALHAAADAGVTLYDTADVYGEGRSERLIGQFLRERSGDALFVATKMGRRAPLDVAEHTPEAFRGWIDPSRDNLGVDRLDLVQLHCLPTDIYYRPEIFAALDDLVAGGTIANYGVSVERVEEAVKAIEFPGVAAVRIIFNMVPPGPP